MENQHLGERAYAILLTLRSGERHGYDIMKQVVVDSDGKLSLGPASLYTILKRLLQGGLISEGSERVDENYRGEQRRRYYQLTQSGVAALEGEVQRSQRFLKVAGRYHA